MEGGTFSLPPTVSWFTANRTSRLFLSPATRAKQRKNLLYSSPKRNCDNEASPATTCPLIFDASLHTRARERAGGEEPRATCESAKVVTSKTPRGASVFGGACTRSWPTSRRGGGRVASLGQQSFVTVLLIMLMRPRVPRARRRRRRSLAQIKGGKRKKNGEPKSLKAYEYLN